MDFGSMIISGSLLIVCIALLYLWFRAEGKINKLKTKPIEEETETGKEDDELV